MLNTIYYQEHRFDGWHTDVSKQDASLSAKCCSLPVSSNSLETSAIISDNRILAGHTDTISAVHTDADIATEQLETIAAFKHSRETISKQAKKARTTAGIEAVSTRGSLSSVHPIFKRSKSKPLNELKLAMSSKGDPEIEAPVETSAQLHVKSRHSTSSITDEHRCVDSDSIKVTQSDNLQELSSAGSAYTAHETGSPYELSAPTVAYLDNAATTQMLPEVYISSIHRFAFVPTAQPKHSHFYLINLQIYEHEYCVHSCEN